MLEWVEIFIIPALFLTVPLLVIILVKFGYRLLGKKIQYQIPEDSNKYGYVLLAIALVLCVLSTSPIAGQGYDTPIFIFRADYIHKNGLQAIFQTDRPLTYLITEAVTNIFNVSGRVSIPISSVIFTTFLTFSVFVLVMVLTKNTMISAMSSFFVVGSKIIRSSALCFVGNMFGFALLYLFFATIIKFYKTRKKLYFVLSTAIFICLFFSHFSTALIVLLIFISFILYLLITKNQNNLISLGICLLLYSVLFNFFLIGYGENFIILNHLIGTETIMNKTGTFFQYLFYSWSSDYIWIFLFTAVGSLVVLFEGKLPKKFLTSWILMLVLTLIGTSISASRIFIYLPFFILSSIGVFFVVDRYLYQYKRKIIFCIFLFLMLVPLTYYIRVQHMNIKYSKEGPFPWDTKFLEIEQLKWIKYNYNIDSIVVLTDVLENSSVTNLKDRGLRSGVDTRILAKIGSNVYFGKLSSLFMEKVDKRGNNTSILGKYSSLNVDWTLQNKTILIPTTIYKINQTEKEICYNVTDGIYAVKPLTLEEKQNWLKINSLQGDG